MDKRNIALIILVALALVGGLSAWQLTGIYVRTAETLQKFDLKVQSLREFVEDDETKVELRLQAQNGSDWPIKLYSLTISLRLNGNPITSQRIPYHKDPIEIPAKGETALPAVVITIPHYRLPLEGVQWFVQMSGEMELPVVGRRPFQRMATVARTEGGLP